jgi:hypothetical protein
MRQFGLTMLMVIAGGLLGPGCGKTVYRSHEAQFCSTDKDDDPFYECSPSADLVCINTYSELVLANNDAGSRRIPLYLCRLACDPATDRCPNGELCCPGKIEGRTYGKSAACVPATKCDSPFVPDGGFDLRPDRGGGEVSGGEAGGDAPSSDAPDDAGAADTPVDAPASDAGV